MSNKSFPLSRETRNQFNLFGPVFQSADITQLYQQAQQLSYKINLHIEDPKARVSPGRLLSLFVLRLAKQDIINFVKEATGGNFTKTLISAIDQDPSSEPDMVSAYNELYQEDSNNKTDLSSEDVIEEIILLLIENRNPAISRETVCDLYTFQNIEEDGILEPYASSILKHLSRKPLPWDTSRNIISFLSAPAKHSPKSISGQLNYILDNWEPYISYSRKFLFRSLDFLKEEERPYFPPGPGPTFTAEYHSGLIEYEAFSKDSNWMPNVVMLAKSTLVWLHQLSEKYGFTIERLDQIPDQELDIIAEQGFTALWLIGLWERSSASKKIKQLTGNPEAEASAYSLNSYEIASTLGGRISLANFKERCAARGIRLASDMVPNHTGVDSDWVINRPDLFLQTEIPPFPSYTFNSEDLSRFPDVGIFLEDHYYNQTDAAVSFKRTDKRTGKSVYIYHGNDGTSMPWNDTAQLNYLNPETRETVIREIIHVAKQFPIIRFDAAMTLAKKHIQRLWYPKPGTGGDIPGRAVYGMDQPEFDMAIPVEFWREVVDRIAAEVPDTLLLAEAFWMMEGYFVRTLGMHRVYNSAFMNMLKLEENRKYRDTIKNTIAFDPEVLKRFVNFMNNPDEDTAIEQFGDGDKYFGVCTLLVTMPGLPMVGHGQIEGFREKYGMEFSRSYRDESPDQILMNSHYNRIFPLMHKRYLFSGSDNFALYDAQGEHGVQESIFAYTNRLQDERALVLYNNSYQSVGGWILKSAPFLKRFSGDERRTVTTTLAESLLLTNDTDYYCILKGFHNGLYYILSSAEIHKKGMHIMLKGYESQVFLDIKEIKDIDGDYSRLCGHLDGKGVRDIEHEAKRIRLHAIHTAAESLVSEHITSLITAVLNGSKSAADLLPAALMKISINIGAAWAVTHFSENSSLSHSVYRPTEAVFSKAVDTLLKLSESVSSPDTPLRRYISNSLSLMPEIPAVLAGWLLCLPIHMDNLSQDTRDYSTELLLNEFLNDQLHESGIVVQDIMRVAAAIDSIFENSGWFSKMVEEKKSSNEQLARFLTAHSFRLFIKANWYEGVEWYHKESFQESLFWLVFSEISGPPKHVSGRDQKLYQTIINWLKKESSAAYRVSALLSD
ncbi:MAG: hypothetical protein KAQ69_09035 [Spirochaetales bacterium]|nr:hypothetical protein [Spirochaetales bacterium]